MQKNSVISITLSILISSLFIQSANAGDLEWSGIYRFEGYSINNPNLNGRGRDLGYGQHHLVLRPKIVAGDGLTIFGQFNILNEENNYANSQMGDIWGSGVRGNAAANTTTSSNNSNALSERQASGVLRVSQLYLTLSQEYGSLIVGRAPLQFGLGMTHNAGRGLFDHWYDTRDLAGYKFLIGNFFVMPMYGKPSEGEINKTDDVTDLMVQAQYTNPETDLELGAFYHIRKSSDQGSDAPISANPGEYMGGAGATTSAGISSKQINLYALRNSQNLRLGLEASFLSGETGVRTAGGANVTYDSFGVAFELEYRPESRWVWGLNAGMASGDDPTTDDKFEGFIFDRNYDVAMLMFNRPLGENDVLRTRTLTGNVRDADGYVNQADVEAISNVFYVAPRARYKFNDRWSLDNSVITGVISTNPLLNKDIPKSLGFEWDISLNFTPRKGVMWVNQVGMLFPGGAFEGGTLTDPGFSFGLATKAAISF